MAEWKAFFSVPEGEKIKEKYFRRMLAASICSILLCVTCLVSVTWAWFSVSVEYPDNALQMGEFRVGFDVENLADSTEEMIQTFVLSPEGEYGLEMEESEESLEPSIYRIGIYNQGNVGGYCQIDFIPVQAENGTAKTEKIRTFYTTTIEKGGSLTLYLKTEEYFYLKINPIWGEAEEEKGPLLGEGMMVSGGDAVSTISGSDGVAIFISEEKPVYSVSDSDAEE